MLPGVKNGARRGTFFVGPELTRGAGCTPLRSRSRARPRFQSQSRSSFRFTTIRTGLAAAALLALPWLAACDGEVTLVDPAPLFRFDPGNTWPLCSSLARGDAGDNPAAEHAAPEQPPGVPPPPGLSIAACPNPAPPGTPTLTIQFRLDVRVPSVNLAIVSSRGEIVRVLLDHRVVGVNEVVRVPWPLDGVEPGAYRAYFLAGRLETSGDLKVE